MTFANPFGLLGLLALPAILVIHLYHRRFPPLMVAGLHLWGVETQVRAAGRKREKLPLTASLLLELFAALILSLVLARPQFGAVTSMRHLVVVLDNSASMSTQPPDDISFRDAAVALIERRMRAQGRRTVATIILSGPRPVMLAGPAVAWDEAKPKLAAWQPRLARHEFGPAWDLGEQLAASSSDFLFVTDHLPPRKEAGVTTQEAESKSNGASDSTPQSSAPTPRTLAPGIVEPYPARMEWAAVGRPLPNVAISAARWTFDSKAGQGNVFLRLDNHASRPVDVAVLGRSGNRDVFRKTVSIAAEGSVPLEATLPGGLVQLDIQAASPGDGLALDSHVTLIEPQVRNVTAAITLVKDDPAARFVQRVISALPDVQPGEPDNSHLVIGPADSLPESRRDLWWLGIGPLDRSEEARKKAIDLADRTPYVLDKRHPLLNGVVLQGIIWGGVQPAESESVPLITSGSQRLLTQLTGTQTTAFLLNIDLGRSNLPESPDWPILLSNLVELRRDNLPGLRQWNYRLNEQIRFRLFEGKNDPGGEELRLWHDGQSRPLARSGMVEVPPLDDTGVYEVRDGERTVGRFAVNFFDPGESTLSVLHSGTREPSTPTASDGFAIDNPYSWLLLLGLALIIAAAMGDWRVLKKT